MGSGSEAEKESVYTPKLPLFSSPQAHMQSPERSGTLTPPLQASASVPFRWEEEPGKPKPCSTLTIFSNPNPNPNDLARRCLQLPRGFQSSSSFRTGSECYGSFDGGSRSPEMVQLGTMLVSKRGTYREKGLPGSWRKRAFKAGREVGGAGNSCVFPSSGDRDGEESNGTSVKITRIKRVGSFHSLFHSKPKFWASIYQGLKVAVPWSKRERDDGFTG
ncbi:hypothetical protein V6N13_004919 [Hibiscus sabdariffa]|uniref:Uncharacterized protein n=1 Tax=Hibiscus sabdariffa TaxID=183260 RepID=A0ABR2RZY1_9ROSI